MGRAMEGWRRLRSWGRRRELESGLDEEIRFHIDAQIQKNLKAGLSPEEARRQALIKFGGVERAREGTRDQFRFRLVEDFFRDLRYAGRSLRRAPAFTIVATVTLAFGIGASAAMFSVVNGVLLRPLPYPEQDRLIDVVHQAPGVGIGRLASSPAIYFTYADHNRTFDGIAQWDWDKSPVTVSGSGEPEAVPSLEVTTRRCLCWGPTRSSDDGLARKTTAPAARRRPSFPIGTGSESSAAPTRSGGRWSWTAFRVRSSVSWPRRSSSSGIPPTSSTRCSSSARRPGSPRSTAAPSPGSRRG